MSTGVGGGVSNDFGVFTSVVVIDHNFASTSHGDIFP
jgi:hypothetical protein